MRIIRNIVLQSLAPDINNLWLKDGQLYYFDGVWKPITNNVNIANYENGVAVETPVIKLGNSDSDLKNNIDVCSKLSTTEVVSVNIEGSIGGIIYDAIGIYHNGAVSILEGNKVTVFDVDFNTGKITIDSKYDTSKLLSYVDLEIGDSDVVKAYNKEHLPTGSFFVAIDYGYGTGAWNSTTGGLAHIVTALGNTVYYSIEPDGAVSKVLESPDIYYEYTLAGGIKNPTQFILTLKGLIDA